MPTSTPIRADTAAIQQAADLLRQGLLVAFPTETVYGLGADASNPEAVKRIFAAKGRPADHPLIVHIPSLDCLEHWAIDIPVQALTLAKHFWPGPLAIILNKHPRVPLEVTGGQSTIALRIPNHPVALQLLQAFGGGVAAPSANRYCRISPTQAQHVADELGDAVDFILDGGACQVGVESTIIDLSTDPPKLLRPGHISRTQLETFLDRALVLPNTLPQPQSAPRAPGMMAVHYAPSTPALRCRSAQLPAAMQKLAATHPRMGLLTHQPPGSTLQFTQVIQLPGQADAYAQLLYASLRQLDQLHLDLILIEQPPEIEAWQAVNDRLSKAAVAYP